MAFLMASSTYSWVALVPVSSKMLFTLATTLPGLENYRENPKRTNISFVICGVIYVCRRRKSIYSLKLYNFRLYVPCHMLEESMYLWHRKCVLMRQKCVSLQKNSMYFVSSGRTSSWILSAVSWNIREDLLNISLLNCKEMIWSWPGNTWAEWNEMEGKKGKMSFRKKSYWHLPTMISATWNFLTSFTTTIH